MSRRRSLSTLLRAAALVALPAILIACGSGGEPAYPDGCPKAQPAALGPDDVRTVTIATDKGDIVIDVRGSLSPIATGNFVALAECGYYDGVVFHRVLPGFVIQAGDREYGRAGSVSRSRVGSGGPPYTIQDEPVAAAYERGTVAMARTPEPDSAGSQFFIVLSEEARASLEEANTYQIIGTVTSGMDTVDAIAAAADAETPASPVVMTDVSVATP